MTKSPSSKGPGPTKPRELSLPEAAPVPDEAHP